MPPTPMIVHFDCNNFFVSCELIDRPDLAGQPAIVANCTEAGGGVVLALNAEAKQLGLKRGQPVFQVRTLIERCGVVVFQTDHDKYRAISKQLMQRVKDLELLLRFVPYSIDEFFGELPLDRPDEAEPYARQICRVVAEELGVGISCGIASTYTLAKAATWFAKRYPAYRGVCPLPDEKRAAALELLPATEVWGLGRRSVDKLQQLGIRTALDFSRRSEVLVRRWFGTGGVQTWHELQGRRSVVFERSERQKSIMHSRAFVRHVSDLDELRLHLADHVAAAARKLREQHSVCRTVSVRLRTNPHRTDLPQYTNRISLPLPTETSDTLLILKTATEALRRIYRPHYLYKKIGVLLSDIRSDAAVEQDLFVAPTHNNAKSRQLMSAIDSLNTRFGRDKIRLATQALPPAPSTPASASSSSILVFSGDNPASSASIPVPSADDAVLADVDYDDTDIAPSPF